MYKQLENIFQEEDYDPNSLEWVQILIKMAVVTRSLDESLEIVGKPNMRQNNFNELKHAIQKAKKNGRLQLFDPNIPSINKQCKAIFIGMTGSGKSSIINFFHTWSQKITQIKNIQNTLIPTKYFGGQTNELAHNQSESQTQISTTFQFDLEANLFKYDLQFIDTPGLGDTRGFEYDEKNVDNILKEIRKHDDLGAIVIMINGTDARVDHRMKYLIQKIKGMLPAKIIKNVVLLLSNVQTTSNLDYSTLDLEIKKEQVFVVDNSVFSANLQKLTGVDREDPNWKDFQLELQQHQNNYLKTQFQMTNFLKFISGIRLQNTQDFELIANNRDEFKICLVSIQEKIKDMVQLRIDAQTAINDIGNGDIKITDLNIKKQLTRNYQATSKKETDRHNTTCTVCPSTCHESCRLDEITQVGSTKFKGCQAFCGDNCMVCTHSYESHVHTKYIWIIEEKTEILVDQDILNQIHQYTDVNQQKHLLIKALQEKIQKLTDLIESKKGKINSLLANLRSLCKEFNYIKELDFYQRILEQKKQQNHKDPSAVKSIEITMQHIDEIKKLVI